MALKEVKIFVLDLELILAKIYQDELLKQLAKKKFYWWKVKNFECYFLQLLQYKANRQSCLGY